MAPHNTKKKGPHTISKQLVSRGKPAVVGSIYLWPSHLPKILEKTQMVYL